MKFFPLLLIAFALVLTSCDLEEIGEPTARAPKACLTANQESCEVGCTINFNAGCSENVATYRWDFDGNGTFDESGADKASVSHLFSAAGNFTVKLEVQNAAGQKDEKTLQVTIQAKALPASFSYALDCYKVSFTNTSPQGTTFTWDFGGEGSSNQKDPNFTFPGPGTYPVSLAISDNTGLGDTTVNIEIPWASFEQEFGSSSEEESGVGIVETAEGDFIAIGVSFDKIFGLKISACGKELDNKLLASEENIAPGDMLKLSNGNYAFTGFNNTGQNGFIFIMNESLTLGDLNNYAAPAGVSSYYSQILETANQELVIYGKKYGANDGGWGAIFRRVDLTGSTTIAQNRYNADNFPTNGEILETSDGNFLVYGTFSDKIRVVQLDKQLNLINNGSGHNYIETQKVTDRILEVQLEKLSNGRYLLFGNVQVGNYWLPYLIQIKEGGGLVFDKQYAASDFKNAVPGFSGIKFKELADGYLFAGSADYFNRYFMMKTDFNGNIQWEKIYGTFGSGLSDLQIASDGGFVMIGNGAGVVDEDQILVIKTDSDGNVVE